MMARFECYGRPESGVYLILVTGSVGKGAATDGGGTKTQKGAPPGISIGRTDGGVRDGASKGSLWLVAAFCSRVSVTSVAALMFHRITALFQVSVRAAEHMATKKAACLLQSRRNGGEETKNIVARHFLMWPATSVLALENSYRKNISF